MMLAKAVLGASVGRVWLYDTFAGMSGPTAYDVSIDGRSANEIHASKQRDRHNGWAFAPLDDVRESFRRHGLLDMV